MFSHYLAFLGSWWGGMLILFFMLKNQSHTLKFSDVLFTFVLSALLSVVFSFAAEKANLFHWVTCVGFAFLGGFTTYKFLNKNNQPSKLLMFNPMLMLPLLNIFHSGILAAFPFALQALAIWTLYRAYKASKNGSIVGGSSSNPQIKDGGGNMNVTATAQFIFFIFLQAAAIGVFILIASDYKSV